MMVADATAQLTAAGLACRATSTPRIHILGGTRAIVERGIQVYENPFAILERPGAGFAAMVAGARGLADTETLAPALAEAVRAIVDDLHGREATRPPAMTPAR